jgi:hypothetical protein
MLGELPDFICSSHVLMEIFREKCKEIKRELFMLGQVPVLMHSPKVWEHPWAHTLKCPSLKKMHSYVKLTYNILHTPAIYF